MSIWNQINVAVARKMWADGFTASEIAPAIGTTRSAVLGKLNRLGVLGKATRHRSVPKVYPTKRRAVVRVDRKPPPQCAEPILARPPVPRSPRESVLFMATRDGECRWPLWNDATPPKERRCCGREVTVDRTWLCNEHISVGTAPRGKTNG